MSYSRDYIFEKILLYLPELTITERKLSSEDNSSVFIFDYKGYKAKIDVDSFVRKLGSKKTDINDKKVDEFIYYIVENLKSQSSMEINNLDDITKKVFPVLRATGFNKDNKKNLIKFSHTNETDIYLAVDFAKGYKLLTKKDLDSVSIAEDELLVMAKENLANLELKYNKDEVLGNTFYFLNAKDGYDGARFLDKNVLNYFYEKIGGSYYIGLPHQDTLIIADIKNKKGLEILQKMMVHFFTEGLVPITTITFKYDGENVESLFIFVE